MNIKGIVFSFVSAVLLCAGKGEAAEASARITKIWTEKTNVVVQVRTTGPVLKVTLESSPRVGRRSWEPRAIRYLTNGEPEGVEFTLTAPITPTMEILRVRSDLTGSSLPATFYQGSKTFVSGSQGSFNGRVETAAPNFDAGAPSDGGGRSVVESDIWKLEGDRLFFFNQNRGLQVIDVSNPDQPVITGQYDLAAAGEQMYVIDGTKIVLLARDNCSWWGSSAESRLILLEVRAGVPQLVKTLPVAGHIAESRLVGTALYVVANSYQKRTISGDGTSTFEQWEWGSEVTSYDLANFEAAERKSADWIPGYGNVISATDRYLFVAQADYTRGGNSSIVHFYDITAPDGVFSKVSTVSPGGIVKDKFKMHMVGNTFVCVVQENSNARGTYVSTFSLENPSEPQRLAYLKIIENEQLFATRFHGDLLYIVTFFVIDPLWVVDLSDPANPQKVGELEIPGWSTYLQPIGDKLLAIGLDRTEGTQRTTVQLFDVADPSKPGLLSKVFIGDQWSGSEANWDEKAFGVLPQHNLLLVPFHSSGPSGYFEGVQLIDLNDRELVKRGIIMQNMGPRRATVHRDRILSLSSRELLTVDATNRDQPKVTTKTELSWAADQLHLAGNHLIEVDAYRSEGPALRVVTAADTGTVLTTAGLTNLPYMGSKVSGTKLYVLQGRSVQHIYPEKYDPASYRPISTNPAVFFLSVFDLSQLPAMPLVGTAEKESDFSRYIYGRYEGLEVKPGLLVWSTSETGGAPWWYWRGPMAIDVVAFDAAPSRGLFAPDIWWGGGSGHLIAVDTTLPAFVSEVELGGTNNWWNFSRSHTTNGLVYLSHSINEYDPTIDPPPYTYEYSDGKQMIIVTNDPPPGLWVQRDYLNVVDFNEPAEPVVRKPVNIPGALMGIDRRGEVIYTRSHDLQLEEVIAAAAYDGLQAHHIDSFPLSRAWPRPALANGSYIYAGVPGPNNVGGTLEAWKLSDAGKFEVASKQEVKEPVQHFALFDDLLVAQSGALWLFDAGTPEQPRPLGTGEINSCYGLQLNAGDGDAERGLWLPMGWYGVVHIPVPVTTTEPIP